MVALLHVSSFHYNPDRRFLYDKSSGAIGKRSDILHETRSEVKGRVFVISSRMEG
jgi:hypothetical protein